MICDDKVAMRAIDEELARGMSGVGVARLMTLRGFKVGAATVNQHDKHRVEAPPPEAKLKSRDAAVFIRDKVLDRVEAGLEDTKADGSPKLDILDKHLQPALKTALQAQSQLDRRVSKVNDQKLAAIGLLLSGARRGRDAIPPELLIEDGRTIEGEFIEVPDEPS